LSEELDKVEVLSTSSVMVRLMHAPLRYLCGQFFNKVIYPITKKEKVVRAFTFFGVEMKVALPAGSDLLFTHGKSHDSELRLVRFLLREVKEGSQFLDIGAHFGYFTLLAARLTGPTGKVCSYEPGKHTYAVLSQNVSGNAVINTFNRAVSSENTKLEFYEFPAYYSEYNTMDVSQFEQESWFARYKPEKIIVDAETIDSITSDGSIIPQFIKIDVEGAEDRVIAGGRNYFKDNNPIVIMEYVSITRNNGNHKKAIEYLLSFGFSMAIIRKDGSIDDMDPKKLDEYLESHGLESDNIVFRKV